MTDVEPGAPSIPATPLRVRPATPADADQIAVVHVRTWQAAYDGLLPRAYLDGLEVAGRAQAWRRWLTEDGPSLATLVAEHDTEVVGFVNLCATRDRSAAAEQVDEDTAPHGTVGEDTSPHGTVGEITAIYVLPQWWNAGAGRALMDAAVTWLGDCGFTAATLWVLEGNRRARRFYEAAGWRTDGAVQEESIGGTPAREVRYRRPLPPSRSIPSTDH